MSTTTTPAAAPAVPNLEERTVYLSVRLGKPGLRAKVDAQKVATDADKKMLHLTKTLLESKEHQAVSRLDGEIRGTLRYEFAVFAPGGGMYLIPIASVEQVDNAMEKFAERRAELIAKAVASYPERVAAAKETLGDLWNPADYDSVEQYRAAFTMETRYVAFSTPTTLKHISQALFQKERDKYAAHLADASSEVTALLRFQMKQLVDKMVERLTPEADGKAKTFKKGTVDNLAEFLSTFSMKNVTDDAQLKSVVEQARQLLKGVSAEDLRKVDRLREDVNSGMAELQSKLNQLVVEKPRRMISFED
jgi:hypothetical protein